MQKKLTIRKRELLLGALTLYYKKADSLKKGVEELGLSAVTLDTAIGHAEAAGQLLMKSKDGVIELETIGGASAFRSAAREALAFNLLQLGKVEKKQIELLVEPSDTKETMEELRALREEFSDQLGLAEELEHRLNDAGINASVTVGP